MNRLNRRQVLGGAPAVHAQKRGRTLRFVAQADLKTLDPVWTTAYITRNHGYLVYDILFGTDEQQQIKPQMIDRVAVSTDGMKYSFTLRDGLRWHDGQPVRSEDCVECRSSAGAKKTASDCSSWPTRERSLPSTRRRSPSSSPSPSGPSSTLWENRPETCRS